MTPEHHLPRRLRTRVRVRLSANVAPFVAAIDLAAEAMQRLNAAILRALGRPDGSRKSDSTR